MKNKLTLMLLISFSALLMLSPINIINADDGPSTDTNGKVTFSGGDNINTNQKSNTKTYVTETDNHDLGFGLNLIHGQNLKIGANMGNSIWHQTFGIGGDKYYDQDKKQVLYAYPGYNGWIIVAVMAIVFIIIKRKMKNSDY